MEISLREVTKDNWLDVINLQISPQQQDYVAQNAESIAESHFYDHYVNRAIYRGEEVVGFLQYYQELEEGLPDEFYIAQFMVDLKRLKAKLGLAKALASLNSINGHKVLSLAPSY